jgi:hypothetical protein
MRWKPLEDYDRRNARYIRRRGAVMVSFSAD